MNIELAYIIKFVTDMDKSIKFYRDILGLRIKMQSDKWTEFDTGATILALHLTTEKKIAGNIQLGFSTKNIDEAIAELRSKNVEIPSEPRSLHGVKLAEFIDGDGSPCTLSGK
jgi:lactoylglutathione lyase